MCCVCTVTVEMNNFAVFTFTFTFVCHPGKTHNLRSRGDTSRRAQTLPVKYCTVPGTVLVFPTKPKAFPYWH